MTITQLRTPILDGGIKSINFFNGRLLSGEDLSQEQIANRQAHQLLGQAIGDGVVSGLEVSETSKASTAARPVITVKAGQAINRQGEVLALTADKDITLVRPAKTNTSQAPALFADCQPSQAGKYVSGAGVYLLTIGSVLGSDGKAPVSGLGNIEAACNTRYRVDGVQFRLIQLDVSNDDLNDAAHLRNRLAYRCFGVSDQVDLLSNPFGPSITTYTTYGLIDELRDTCLTDSEVPLALLHWTTTDGLKFIDLWSVRRRITPRSATARWPLFVADRRVSEAEAMFLQFQDQIEEMRLQGTNLGSIIAANRFDYLPSAGMLPVGGPKGSFDYRTFFGGHTYRDPVFVEGAQARSLMHDSFNYPPIDVGSRELIWLYLVRENVQAIDNLTRNLPQAYLMFASGHMRYRGEARFDVNRWNYSNFS